MIIIQMQINNDINDIDKPSLNPTTTTRTANATATTTTDWY